MDAKAFPVISVLSDPKRFVVPIYQRQYTWREPRLTPFWEDIVAKAEEALIGKPKFQHYMGALIIAPGADGYSVGTTPKVQVVDGQQRLTTFQIFLAALREVATRLDCLVLPERLNTYIFNAKQSGDAGPEAQFKLVPTPVDKILFHAMMAGNWENIRQTHPQYFWQKGTLRRGEAPNTLRALDIFIQRIEDYARFGIRDEDADEADRVDDDGATQHARLAALADALLLYLKLVVITLEEGDDAQVIFETLNSKAEPLLAMDLVRNNIFHRAGEAAEALFEAKWKPFDDQFWKDPAPRAKPMRPRIDHFLSHALSARTGQEISLRELYAEYRAFTRPKGQPRFPSVDEELDALLQFAPVYRALEDATGKSALARLGGKLATWEITTVYPVVFAIATAPELDESEAEQLYRLIYSYVVRRAVCDLTPKGLNKTFARIVAMFLRTGVSVTTFAASFADQTGDTVRFPSDDDFRAAIRENRVYQRIARKERLLDILWELELASRTKYMANAARPPELSIEHVLPQTWREHWPLPDGRTAPADGTPGIDAQMVEVIAARERLLQTLGNLTLATTPLNGSLSNGPFGAKRAKLKEGLLALNLHFEALPSWGEEAIRVRADRLADLAVQIWPALPQ
jgi:hypothetical protein